MKTKLFSYLAMIVIIIWISSCSKSNSYVPVTTYTGTNTTNTTGSTSTSPGANEVWMQNTAFVPASKTITVGTTITWTNKDASTHDVSSSAFTSPDMGQNATFSYTFTTVGTYNYKCVFHAGMNGTIIVQ